MALIEAISSHSEQDAPPTLVWLLVEFRESTLGGGCRNATSKNKKATRHHKNRPVDNPLQRNCTHSCLDFSELKIDFRDRTAPALPTGN
jgi:hypothetical protein